MTKARQHIGRLGEDLACEFLKQHHYQIIERNFRCELGELDIVAGIDEYLVFCEVKTRRGQGAIHPTASITTKKIKKLHELGLWYIQQKHLYQLQPRFDVVAIQWHSDQSPEIEHFINAL